MLHPLVETWLTKFGDLATSYLVTHHIAPDLSHQLNYDGVKCWVLMSDLLADRDPTTSAALFAHAEQTMSLLSVLDAGPDDTPHGPAGYYNYNIGPRMMMDDPRSDDSLRASYGQIACNFARGTAFANPVSTLNFRWNDPSDGSWPNAGIPRADPTAPPIDCRQHALAVLSHLTTDDIYGIYESREARRAVTPYDVVPYVQTHDWYIPEFLSRWFLGFDCVTGLARPYRACIDQWRDTSELAETRGGDFSQDDVFWLSSWRPFMFQHVCRMLIAAYDHPAITGHPQGVMFRARILLAVHDLCDISLRWFVKPSQWGNPSLAYEIAEGGVMSEFGAPDLALFEMSMFAWSAKMTGNSTHRDFAIALIETGLADGYWIWGKHWNQGVIEALEGFDYLGFLSEEDEGMTIDIAALRALVDQFEVEQAETETARVALETAQATVATAQDGLTAATTEHTRENEEMNAKKGEIITLLNAG